MGLFFGGGGRGETRGFFVPLGVVWRWVFVDGIFFWSGVWYCMGVSVGQTRLDFNIYCRLSLNRGCIY